MRSSGIPRILSRHSTTTSDPSGHLISNSRAGNVGAPIRQVMLKLHSRCNLACDYCYVYRNVDQTWRDQPVTMSRETVDLAALRIAEHADRHQLPFVTVIFHGGEPLLAGAGFIAYAADAIRSAVRAPTRVDLHLQTNGILLDEEFLGLFDRHQIRVGVSLDGAQAAHDRHRVFADGQGSFQRVARALRLLGAARYRHLYGGILCTVNVHNDAIETFQGLMEFQPPRMDFLLPHGNWTTPPPDRSTTGTETPYADWLIPVFDAWYSSTPQRTSIRLFESLIDLVLGGPSRSEAVGLAQSGLLVVECDGSIEQNDVLKTTAAGAAATGLYLRAASFDDANAHPAFRTRQGGLAELAAACRSCPVVRVCGGGLYAHRYQESNGFDNPSVYCRDLMALIIHIRTRVGVDLARLGIRVANGH